MISNFTSNDYYSGPLFNVFNLSENEDIQTGMVASLVVGYMPWIGVVNCIALKWLRADKKNSYVSKFIVGSSILISPFISKRSLIMSAVSGCLSIAASRSAELDERDARRVWTQRHGIAPNGVEIPYKVSYPTILVSAFIGFLSSTSVAIIENPIMYSFSAVAGEFSTYFLASWLNWTPE